MSSTVRTSSRIQARKNKLHASSEQETTGTVDAKKKRVALNSQDEAASQGQGHKSSSSESKPAAKHETPSIIPTVPTTISKSTSRLSTAVSGAASTTPSKSTSRLSTSVSGAPPKENAPTATSTITMTTRSSQRSSSATKELKEEVLDEPAESALPETSTSTSPPKLAAAVTTPAVAAPVSAHHTVHVFKNPNFTYSNRGGIATGKKTRTWKSLKQIIASERTQIHRPIGSTYSSIDTLPSRKPAKKYSDVSGLPARYTDPRTKLRYANAEEFAQLRTLPTDLVNGLLALRRANLDVQ